MTAVPLIGRILDLAGLLLFLGGAGLFVRAWIGFRGVSTYAPPIGDPSASAIAIADGYWRLQKIGGALMLAGVLVFVIAWWVARARTRGPSR